MNIRPAACVVRGRRFIQHGDEWVDAAAEAMPGAHRVRIRFDTPEFFALLIKRPELVSNMCSVRNVHVVLGDTIFEIYQ